MNKIVEVDVEKVIERIAYLVFEDAKYVGMLMATKDELDEISNHNEKLKFVKM